MNNGEILARKWYAAYRAALQKKFGDHVIGFEQLTPPVRACVLEAFKEVIKDTCCDQCKNLLETEFDNNPFQHHGV